MLKTQHSRIMEYMRKRKPPQWAANPYPTCQEIAQGMQESNEWVHKRLSELRKKGLLINSDPKPCPITGKIAATWRIKPQPVDIKLEETE